MHPFPLPRRRVVQNLCRQSRGSVQVAQLRRRRLHFPLHRVILDRLDSSYDVVPSRGLQLLHEVAGHGRVAVCVRLRHDPPSLHPSNCHRQDRIQDVHDQRSLGHAGNVRHREWLARVLVTLLATDLSQYFFWVETKGKTLEEIDAVFYKDRPTSLDILHAAREDKNVDVATVVRHIEQQSENEDPDDKSQFAV